MRVKEFYTTNVVRFARRYPKPQLFHLFQEGNDDVVNEDEVLVFDKSFKFEYECPDILEKFKCEYHDMCAKSQWPHDDNTYDLHFKFISITVDTETSTIFFYPNLTGRPSSRTPPEALLSIDCSDISIAPSSNESPLMNTIWKAATVLAYSHLKGDVFGFVPDFELSILPNFYYNKVHIIFRMALKTRFISFSYLLLTAARDLRDIATDTFVIDSVDDDIGSPRLCEISANDANEVSPGLFYRIFSAHTQDMAPVPTSNLENYVIKEKLLPFQRQTVD